MKRMLKKKKTLFGLLVAVLTLGMVGTHCGHSRWHSWNDEKRPAEMAQKIADHISDRLDLDDAQELKTRDLVLDVLKSGKEMRTHRAEMLAELEKQFRSDSFDAKSLNSLSEKSEQDFQNFRTTLIQRMAEFHGILNQEQKEEAAELIARIRQKHGQ